MFHILLIDDNTFFTATFAGLLQRTGYQVTVAEDLTSGQDIHTLKPADLVLLGMYLQRTDSDVYLQELRSTFAGTPVIGLFGDGDRDDRQFLPLLRELGPERVYHKPFRTEDLLQAIQTELVSVARRAS